MLSLLFSRIRLVGRVAAPQLRWKTLVIVESATKAKTIQQYLHEDYIVDYSAGHIRDLMLAKGKSGDLISQYLSLRTEHIGIDVYNNFTPLYTFLHHKTDIITRLQTHLSECDALVLATDDDREGEAIAWHLLQVLQPTVPVNRAVLHEITKDAVLRALSSPRSIDMALVEAQETRRMLDRLTGFTLSPLLWRILGNQVSAGRVQSAALQMICQREAQRWAFQSTPYYTLHANFRTATATLVTKLVEVNGRKVATEEELQKKSNKTKYTVLDDVMARNIINYCKSNHSSFRVSSVTHKQSHRQPPVPFITSTLQQEAVAKLGLASSHTMSVAQSLYEKGYITYMRTDNPELSEEGRDVAIATVKTQFGTKYVSSSKRKSKVKIQQHAQLAHEAIRPATHNNQYLSPDTLEDTEKALYELIYNRTLASVMSAAVMNTSTATVTSDVATDAVQSLIFRVSQSEYTFDGFRRVLPTDTNISDASVSELNANDTLQLHPTAVFDNEAYDPAAIGLLCKLHSTQPPARYTDGSFIHELESVGIGRPSTYATILPKLRERGYVLVDKHSIVPTVKGLVVAQLLHKLFPTLLQCSFTATMESKLDMIAAGKMEKTELLRDYYLGTSESTLKVTGLLPTVESVLKQHKAMNSTDQYRELCIPCIEDIGTVVYYKNNVVLRTVEGKWPLSPDMQDDIRLITRDAINVLKQGEQMGSRVIGSKVINGKELEVRLCSGRYGMYIHVGDDQWRKKKIYNVPSWLSPTAPHEQILEFITLPLVLGRHEPTARNIIISVKRSQLCVGLEGLTKTLSLPDQLLPSQVTLAQCLEVLGDGSMLQEVIFGMWKNESIRMKVGRFGHYLEAGDVRCSVKPSLVENMTPDIAMMMIDAKSKQPPRKRNNKKSTKAIKLKSESDKAVKVKNKSTTVKPDVNNATPKKRGRPKLTGVDPKDS